MQLLQWYNTHALTYAVQKRHGLRDLDVKVSNTFVW